jgi:hypothetical protein
MDEATDSFSRPRLRTMQIIAFAQVLGLVLAAAIFVYLVQVPYNGQGVAPPQGLPIFSLVGVAVLTGLALVSFAFPNFLLAQGVRTVARGDWPSPPGATLLDSDAAKLLALYQTTMIIGLALVEGAGFYCCIAYLLEGQPWMLALVALALVLQAARFPTECRVRAWLSRQLDRLEQTRGTDSADAV